MKRKKIGSNLASCKIIFTEMFSTLLLLWWYYKTPTLLMVKQNGDSIITVSPKTGSVQPTSSSAKHTRWYPSSPLDDLSGVGGWTIGHCLSLIRAKAVCHNQHTVVCIHTVSASIHLHSILQFFEQYVYRAMMNFKDRYVPSGTEWSHRRLQALSCLAKQIKTNVTVLVKHSL